MIKISQKIKDLKNDVLEFAKPHCEFHYQASYEYYNLGCGYLKLNMLENAYKFFTKSINIYKENADSHYCRGFMEYLFGNKDASYADFRESFKLRNVNYDNKYVSNFIKYDPYPKINNVENFTFYHHTNENTQYKDLKKIEINILYQHADIAFNAKNYADFVSIYESLIKLTSDAHFVYHVDLANKYFDIAREYHNEGFTYEAIFFCQKALETDDKNPHNSAYQNLLSLCQTSVIEDQSA
ncbi:hypothetical protein [Candidatus Deianiraea vastatrix]|uniref:Tetratricopeptide repeat protein n=1 Tax=Candidatus Deianiraea vastatrix TaxID=2163644 RepID=A0A5B8XC75_9RICK|nr:hypothetical protein [Candidatus Deianiraea vastatrix]QED22938.1 Tetratricopeptide repeat protein [Candidatus Deianiraea vastatrix]